MTRTTQAIVIHETGGPDVLTWDTVPLLDPGPGEVQMRHKAIGLNFLEVNFRAGVYTADLPFVPGGEGAGTVMAVGDGVADWKVGDRVAYAGPRGSYAVDRNIAADRLVALPDAVPFNIAAAMLFKGLTARYLLRQTFDVGSEHRVLYHAAASGLGLIFCQWAASLGAEVIGTVGSEEKAALARAHGCTHVINYRSEDFVARVRDLTDGAGVDVVYDSVGKDTFPGSLECLRHRGLWVLFGRASGSPPPLDMALLGQMGSLYATRPTLANHIATRAQLVETATDLFAAYAAGAFRVNAPRTYPLAEARRAHADMESRNNAGASILLPD